MSRGHSLVLSEQQRSLIVAVADSIQPAWRQNFLNSIQDNLLGCEQVTDGDVMRIIDRVRASFIIGDSDCCGA
jgi:hypothetical protein